MTSFSNLNHKGGQIKFTIRKMKCKFYLDITIVILINILAGISPERTATVKIKNFLAISSLDLPKVQS